jgi:glutamate carboxypeptidase
MSAWKSNPLVGLLQELTLIDSGTENGLGVQSVQKVVERELKNLGLNPAYVSADSSSNASTGALDIAPILVASRAGQSGSEKYVDLVTHADTAWVKSSDRFRFDADVEKTGLAFGPGIIDDKGGIVVALEGLKRFLKKSKGGLSIRLICSPTEETGSQGFHKFFKSLSETSKMVLGFEPSLEDGSIIQSRRGNRWYHIHVHGKEGHAGRDHQHGVNAAHELAFKMVQLHQLTDYGRNLTVSVGQISGGTKFNVICGEAEAKVDVRFSDLKTREEAHQKIEKIISGSSLAENADGQLPQASYEIADDCPSFGADRESSAYVAKYLELLEKVEGKSTQARQGGGSSDANYMSREGLVIIDGLGASGGKIHSPDEFIRLESLETRAECLAQFLEYLETV